MVCLITTSIVQEQILVVVALIDRVKEGNCNLYGTGREWCVFCYCGVTATEGSQAVRVLEGSSFLVTIYMYICGCKINGSCTFAVFCVFLD